MKKMFALILAVLMVAALLAGCGSSKNMTLEKGKLIMSTNAAFPPYEMVADDGSFEGIDVEIAGAVAKKLGLELVVDDMDFDAALLAVQQGKADIVMAGVTVNEDRKMVMNFSDTYSKGVQVVIVKEGSDVTLDNLGDQMIGTQRGTTGYIYTSGDYGEDHVTAYDNGASAVQKSMSKLPSERFEMGTLLNQRLTPQMLATEEDVWRFVDYFRAFEALGNFHVQFNVIDCDTLHKAMEKPEEYKDLLVRVASYVSYFIELGEPDQLDIIHRTEQNVW